MLEPCPLCGTIAGWDGIAYTWYCENPDCRHNWQDPDPFEDEEPDKDHADATE